MRTPRWELLSQAEEREWWNGAGLGFGRTGLSPGSGEGFLGVSWEMGACRFSGKGLWFMGRHWELCKISSMQGDPSAGVSLTVIRKHNHSLCTARGSPAPLREDGKGKAAEAANAKPLTPDSLPTLSSAALLTPLVQSGEKPPVHKPNRRHQARRKREDPTDAPRSP